MIDPGTERLVDHDLERRLVADREKFLRNRLRGGEEPGAHSGGGNDGTAHLHESDDIFSTPMPTYVYKFVDTGETIEVQQAFTDATLTEFAHPDSGEVLAVKKVFTPVGVTFKGSGFFKTDNRGKKSASETGSKKDGDSQVERLEEFRFVVEFRFEVARRSSESRSSDSKSSSDSSKKSDGGLVDAEVRRSVEQHEVGLTDVELMLIPLADGASSLGAEIGVFGGSGFYEFLDDPIDVELTTPFGPPSAPISVGTLAGRRVAFLARHGRDHEYAAHRVPFRANVWAMASLGVRSVIAPCSVGSLQPDIHPGDFVVVDQLIDRTTGRADTFHDVGSGDGLPGSDLPVHHQTFAEPYAAELRERRSSRPAAASSPCRSTTAARWSSSTAHASRPGPRARGSARWGGASST